MAMFELRITPDETGEAFDVNAGMRDVVIWERTHRGRSLAQIGDGNLTATMVFELAFSACRRQQRIPRELTEEQFFESYEVEVEEPAERAARIKAEALKQRIVDGVVPVEPLDDESVDPTPPGA